MRALIYSDTIDGLRNLLIKVKKGFPELDSDSLRAIGSIAAERNIEYADIIIHNSCAEIKEILEKSGKPRFKEGELDKLDLYLKEK